MSIFPAETERLAEQVVALYGARQWQIATAESCTGGLIAAALTEISGSSAVVDRGFVTYSNAAKRELIGVNGETLDQFGAVSRQTALEMACGALARSNAQCAIAVTGIAGPGGGSAEKPVGLVHLALCERSGSQHHRAMNYGDIGRDAVRMATVRTALEMLLRAADQSPE